MSTTYFFGGKIKLSFIQLFSVFCVGFFAQSALAGNLNIGHETSVRRYNMDGTGGTTIISTSYFRIRDVAVDSQSDAVYYMGFQNSYTQSILRDNDPWNYDPGFGDRDTILDFWDNNYKINRLDVDPVSGKLAIASEDPRGPSTYFTRYSNVLTRDIDTGSQQVLWRGSRWHIIGWSGYYDPRPIWGPLHNVADVAVDPVGGKVYWTNRTNGTIMRSNTDGSGETEVLYTGLTNPNSLALDVGAGRIFWTDGGNSTTDGSIQTGTMDGSAAANTIIGGLSLFPVDIDVDPSSQKLFWGDGTIHSADYSGNNIADVTNEAGTSIAGQIVAIGHDAGYTPQNPFTAGSVVGNKLLFEDTSVSDQVGMLFFESEMGIGYDYVSGSSNFASVLLPNVGDGLFDLYLWDGSEFVFDQQISAGEIFDFDSLGVDRFRIMLAGEMIDLSAAGEFLSGLGFASEGVTDVSITVIPEPATLLLVGAGFMFIRKRKSL